MGQKVHPKAFRLNTVATWSSRWFADARHYPIYLRQDVEIRGLVVKRFREAGVASVDIERSPSAVTVAIAAARPGVIIGRGGQGVETLKQELRKKFGGTVTGTGNGAAGAMTFQVNVTEVDRPGVTSEVVMQQIAAELEKRLPFRRVIRSAAQRVQRAGALGVRIQVSGRLNGAEIARREVVMLGSVPLHTLRADINYAQGFAQTIYGTIGVKVWIYRGEVFTEKKSSAVSR
ncbi:MAG: 30S ribosomal protein S3 [Candidatus Uhrbacteria bacterium]